MRVEKAAKPAAPKRPALTPAEKKSIKEIVYYCVLL